MSARPDKIIVSASYRSDIPAFYGDWFRGRLAAGFCSVANPYGGPPSRVPLGPDAVAGFVFWTRNPVPFLGVLAALRAGERPFVVQVTITGYPAALERSVVAPERAIAAVQRLAERFGPRVAVWRYDPVFLSDLTPPEWHLATFERLAEQLAGACDEVVLSFTQVYAKTKRNSDRAALERGFAWWDPVPEVKRALLAELARIALARGLRPSLCSQPALLTAPLAAARCIDAERLAAVAGRPIRAATKGNRPGCLCARSRDIGAYDSCPHGCVYCYAVRSPALAKRRHRAHDPRAERLGDSV